MSDERQPPAGQALEPHPGSEEMRVPSTDGYNESLRQGVVRWRRLALNLVAGLAAGGAVVAIAGSRLGPEIAGSNLAGVRYEYIALAGVCLVIVLLSDALSLVVMTRALSPKASFGGVFGLAFEAHLVGGATSFGGLEIPYQVVRLRYSGLTSSQAASAVLAKGMLHASMLGVVAAAALVPALGTRLTSLQRWLLIGVLVAMALGCLAAVLWTRRPVGMKLVPRRVRKYVASFREANLVLLHAGWRSIFVMVALQAIYWVAMFAIIPLILMALGYYGGIFSVIVAQAVLQLLMSFSPLPGGAGIAELGYLGLIGASIPEDIRVTSLILWRVATWLIPMALGAVVIGARLATSKKKNPFARRREVSGLPSD